MKLRKVLATSVAAAVAVSAMTVSAFALSTENYLVDGTVYVLAEKDSEPNWSADSGVAITDVYGVTFHVEFNADEIADEAVWIGGGIGANSNSTGWASTEWGRNSKPITADLENGTITWLSDAPIFAADDAYAQLWLQTWGGTVTVLSADILGADGVILSTDDGAAASDGTTVAISYVADGPAYTYVVPAGMDTLNVTVAVSEADGDAFNWNDWCGAGIAVNNEKFYQWGGAQVSWGWDADGDENEDSKDGVNGETWAGTVGADGGVLSIPVSEGDVVDFYCLSWDSYAGVQYTLTFEAPSAEAPADADDDAADEDVAEEDEADEDVAENDADEDVAEDDADEDTAEDDTAEEDTAEEDTADTTTEDTTATTGDKTTPDTGVEGVAAVAGLAVVAAGAVIIAKKRK